MASLSVPRPPAARVCFRVAATLLILYVFDVLVGKAAVLLQFSVPWRLGNVGEFVVVLAAVIFFVAGVLVIEARNDSQQGRHPI
ncbi:MAG TPA: hypothetical protein VM937_06090 [Burkholderiaceae bacterium]|nr:hypothetical protein [Burkholderiaceae bacterium]